MTGENWCLKTIKVTTKIENVKEMLEKYMPIARRICNLKLIDELNNPAIKYT